MATAIFTFPASPLIESRNSAAGPRLVSSPSPCPWAALHYPRGAQLCTEGLSADGVFQIVQGRAKECFSSESGKTAILRIAGPGDLIGVEAVLSSGNYATTVQTLEPTKAYFIPRRDLLDALRRDEKFRAHVVQQLGTRCKTAYADIRRCALTTSVSARLAQFLLGWNEDNTETEGGQSIRMSLTHEEIGQLLCISRETASRIISRFRRKGWIRTRGVQWRIQNRQALAALAEL